MELYLDSADLKEIREAFKLGFLTGLTTTPTFMHREGITDIDGTILELAKIVPILQIEALGRTAEEIVAEAKRQDAMGLDREKTVYKIPVSMEGVRACRMLVDEGFKVNVHLVYTLQQAYMAMQAGATYVCPLVGRLQDQGTDALSLVRDCVEAVNYYGYDTKIMFSSVRYVEHVRNAMDVGVHTITVPWKVMKQLTENHFTALGTEQFYEHTGLMTLRVKDLMEGHNPKVHVDDNITNALVEMTKGGFGAVTIVDNEDRPIGIFTDGDLRRLIESEGPTAINKRIGELEINAPQSIEMTELLYNAQAIFTEKKIDCIVVTDGGKAAGMIDIQDMNKLKA